MQIVLNHDLTALKSYTFFNTNTE